MNRYPEDEGVLRGLLNGLYSLKLGRPVGWRFTTLVQVIHRSLGTSPNFIAILAKAVERYRRVEQLLTEDKSGKLAKKIHGMTGLPVTERAIDWQRISDCPKAISLDWLLIQLFPELFGLPLFYLHPSKHSVPGS